LSVSEIEYLGRIDQQVKIRGFRVEPGEIEATLNEHSAVRESVVIAHEEATGDKRLVAYVVARDGEPFSAEDLRNHLQQMLPDYMLPAVFVEMKALPLTLKLLVARLNRYWLISGLMCWALNPSVLMTTSSRWAATRSSAFRSSCAPKRRAYI
jgi:acyl-CoA synthetase (AMP-forming)/AMP-acid ligase II